MEQNERPRYRLQSGNGSLRRKQAADGHSICRIKTEEGTGTRDIYPVFPGIDLIFDDFYLTEWDCRLVAQGDELLELHFCSSGRGECSWVCGDYLYIGAGDLCIARMERQQPPMTYPTGRYQGVSVVLDLRRLREYPLPLFAEYRSQLDELGEKFCPGHHFFAIRANAQIVRLFNELYNEMPGRMRQDYFRVKMLELLLLLLAVDPEEERRVERMTEGQIDVVKAVRERLCEDLGRDLTIEQLSREFLISPTALKSNFKSVFGSSIKEYMRRVRMEHAALMLRTGDLPVAEIAQLLGYSNQSKFASAFKGLYELSPREYRRKCAREHGGL